MFNRELADRIIEQIETHPEQWDQDVWRITKPECGTVCCVAGWACELSDMWPNAVIATSFGVSQTARHLLGLTSAQAGKLFLFTTTHDVDVIKRMFKEFEEENV